MQPKQYKVVKHFFWLKPQNQKRLKTLITKIDCPECGGESSDDDGFWCEFCGSTGLVDPVVTSVKEVSR